MSDDKQPEENDEKNETSGSAPRGGSHNQLNKLSRDSDQAPRPGFRAPSNKRSKASKKKRKKK